MLVIKVIPIYLLSVIAYLFVCVFFRLNFFDPNFATERNKIQKTYYQTP